MTGFEGMDGSRVQGTFARDRNKGEEVTTKKKWGSAKGEERRKKHSGEDGDAPFQKLTVLKKPKVKKRFGGEKGRRTKWEKGENGFATDET